MNKSNLKRIILLIFVSILVFVLQKDRKSIDQPSDIKAQIQSISTVKRDVALIKSKKEKAEPKIERVERGGKVLRNISGFTKKRPVDAFSGFKRRIIKGTPYMLIEGLSASVNLPEGVTDYRRIGGIYYFPDEEEGSGLGNVVYDSEKKQYALWTQEIVISGNPSAIDSILSKITGKIITRKLEMVILKVDLEFNVLSDISNISSYPGISNAYIDLKYSLVSGQ